MLHWRWSNLRNLSEIGIVVQQGSQKKLEASANWKHLSNLFSRGLLDFPVNKEARSFLYSFLTLSVPRNVHHIVLPTKFSMMHALCQSLPSSSVALWTWESDKGECRCANFATGYAPTMFVFQLSQKHLWWFSLRKWSWTLKENKINIPEIHVPTIILIYFLPFPKLLNSPWVSRKVGKSVYTYTNGSTWVVVLGPSSVSVPNNHLQLRKVANSKFHRNRNYLKDTSDSS